MRVLILRLLIALGIIVAVGGCSMPAAPSSPHVPLARNLIPMNQQSTVPSTNGIPALVLSGNYLRLYDASEKQIGTIDVRGQQGAVAFDKQGDIYYDSYEQYSDRVLIYSPPYTAKPKIVSFYSAGYSEGVAVDWNTGVFAIMMDAPYPDPSLYSAGWFYRHGETKPCAVVKEPPTWIWGPTGSFDAHGTLFTDEVLNSGEAVVSISGECHATSVVQYSPALSNIATIQLNTKDQLVVDETTGFNNAPIVTYPHPANGQLGSPVSITTLDEINGNPTVMISLTSDGNRLWASNVFNSEVALYSYPQGGVPLKVLNIPRIGDGGVYPPPLP